MFEIKKNIPIPVSQEQWPFKNMDVGDCVEYPYNFPNAQTSAHAYGKMHGMRFKTKKHISDDGDEILRVWRIA